MSCTLLISQRSDPNPHQPKTVNDMTYLNTTPDTSTAALIEALAQDRRNGGFSSKELAKTLKLDRAKVRELYRGLKDEGLVVTKGGGTRGVLFLLSDAGIAAWNEDCRRENAEIAAAMRKIQGAAIGYFK